MTVTMQQASAGRRKYLDSVEKPLAEKSPRELVDEFEGKRDLTFIFMANSKAHGDQGDYGQDVLPILELAFCANPVRGKPLPFYIPVQSASDNISTSESRERIQRDVEACVRELRSRPDTSFILVWNVAGSTEVHCDASADCTGQIIRSKLVCFCTNIVGNYVG